MKGTILDFSIPESQGEISGDDGNRYTVSGKEWKAKLPPQAGIRVDFETEGRSARSVYLEQPVRFLGAQLGIDSPYARIYRSSDDAMIAGVCAGLAHKWKVDRTGLRVATVLLTLFTIFPLLLYIICWVLFPAVPTKNVD